MSRRVWVPVLAVGLGLTGVAGAHASTIQPRLAAQPIGLETTATATGQALAVLGVPRGVTVKPSDFRLWVTGGTFAVVRMVPVDQPAGCPANAFGAPTCLYWEFDYLRAVDKAGSYDGQPSGTHFIISQAPDFPAAATLPAGQVRLEILTDGKATFRFLPRSDSALPRTKSVRLARQTLGKAAILPTHCTIACVGPVAIRGAGTAFDVGRTGYVEFIALALNEQRTNGSNAATGCFYPNPDDASATPDPSKHPQGCDEIPADASEASSTVAANFNEIDSNASPTYVNGFSEWWGGAHGQVYVGGEARQINTVASQFILFALWVREPAPIHTYN